MLDRQLDRLMSVCLFLPLDFIVRLKNWELLHLIISSSDSIWPGTQKGEREGDMEETPRNHLIYTHMYMHIYFSSYNQNVHKVSKFLISLNYNVSTTSLVNVPFGGFLKIVSKQRYCLVIYFVWTHFTHST